MIRIRTRSQNRGNGYVVNSHTSGISSLAAIMHFNFQVYRPPKYILRLLIPPPLTCGVNTGHQPRIRAQNPNYSRIRPGSFENQMSIQLRFRSTNARYVVSILRPTELHGLFSFWSTSWLNCQQNIEVTMSICGMMTVYA